MRCQAPQDNKSEAEAGWIVIDSLHDCAFTYIYIIYIYNLIYIYMYICVCVIVHFCIYIYIYPQAAWFAIA